jgi:arylformamidase
VRIRPETLLDVSRPLREGMPVWPGDTAFRRAEALAADGAAGVLVSALTLSSHAGTHVDAPRHVDPRGRDLEELGLTPFVGPAIVVDARGRRTLDETVVRPDALRSARRLLFRTDYLAAAPDAEIYGPHIPYLTAALARALVANRVSLVGLDGPSVDPFDSRALDAHRLLAAADVAILEGLDLSHAKPGEWFLIALPLRLAGGEASPVRAVLARPARARHGD